MQLWQQTGAGSYYTAGKLRHSWEMVSDLLYLLDKSMGPGGIHRGVLREVVEVLPKPLPIIYQQRFRLGAE